MTVGDEETAEDISPFEIALAKEIEDPTVDRTLLVPDLDSDTEEGTVTLTGFNTLSVSEMDVPRELSTLFTEDLTSDTPAAWEAAILLAVLRRDDTLCETEA